MESSEAASVDDYQEGAPRIGTLVINFNSHDDLKRCIESLMMVQYANHLIFCVDNGSTDGSRQKLMQEFPDIVHVDNGSNVGFGAGMNAGIAKALEMGCEYVFCFNSDTWVDDPGLFDELLRTFQENPSMGMAGPAEYDYSGNDLLFSGPTGRHEQEMKVSGAAMFISKKMIETVGLFDESFFLGYEDQDLLRRAEKHGFVARTTSETRFMHKRAAITGKHARMMTYLETRNEIVYYARHWDLSTFMRRIVVGNAKRIPRKALLYPEVGRPELFAALVRGVLAGVSLMPKARQPGAMPRFDPSRWMTATGESCARKD